MSGDAIIIAGVLAIIAAALIVVAISLVRIGDALQEIRLDACRQDHDRQALRAVRDGHRTALHALMETERRI